MVLWNRDMCWISAMRVGNGFCRVGMEGLSDGMLIGWVRNRVFNDGEHEDRSRRWICWIIRSYTKLMQGDIITCDQRC